MVIHVVNLTLASENAKRMERQIISPSLFLIRKNGCLLFPVVPHVLDVVVVLEHIEHLLEKKLQFQHICQRHIPPLCRCMSQ